MVNVIKKIKELDQNNDAYLEMLLQLGNLFLWKRLRKQKQGILDFELKKDVSQEDRLKPWVELFNAETKEEMDMIKTGNQGVIAAREVLREMNLLKNLRYLHEERLKEKRDRKAQDDYIYDQGHVAGLCEGEENNLWSLIQRKLSKGKSTAQIAEELETTEEEIMRLIQKRQCKNP